MVAVELAENYEPKNRMERIAGGNHRAGVRGLIARNSIGEMKDVQKLLGAWTLQSAIAERVEKEATLAWALKEDAPLKAIPPMKAQRRPTGPLHVLKSQLRQLIA